VLQITFSVLAISLGLWTIQKIKTSEEEQARKYNVHQPKTPAEFQLVEETSVKVDRFPSIRTREPPPAC